MLSGHDKLLERRLEALRQGGGSLGHMSKQREREEVKSNVQKRERGERERKVWEQEVREVSEGKRGAQRVAYGG